jgi:hypothetical protein
MLFGPKARLISAGLVATVGLATTLALVQTSCGQTPTNVPVRTFQRAGRMDVLCVQVLGNDDAGNSVTIPAIPVTLDHCAPVAPGVDPTTLQFHTLAVVTQTLRGELAVVDLTLGRVVDTSLALPGINFLPVGKNPTDVVVTPDAQTVFVAAAETNKPAIYAIPSNQLLGDSANLDEPTQAQEQLSLPTWPVCALPQAPGRMVVVPTGAVPIGEGGTADAGDGGPGVTQGYEIVVVMPGNGTDESALIGVIDTTPFTDGTIGPGALTPCPIKSIIQLAEAKSALPTSWSPGPAWPNGLPYVDGGIDLFAATATGAPQLPLWSCPALLHGGDAGIADSGTGQTDAAALALAPGGQVHGAGMVTDGRYVWVADQTMPFIHVIDTLTPGTLTEIAPLVATSIVQPTRVVTTSELAISPVTRDYKRYLYAVDAVQGSLMVYDVTDPVNGPRLPLTRPNPELDPLQAPDRILLSSPVATVTFARHDFPLPNVTQTGAAQSGILCNPNPNAGSVTNCATANPPIDPGVCYQNSGPIAVALGPTRLRGVFAFATMTTGQVIAIDVDDWDAPCRRPIALTPAAQVASIAIPEPEPTSSSDIDPFHAPNAGDASVTNVGLDGGLTQPVTDEVFWPVIQPHRLRSQQLEEDDTLGTGGLHAPEVTSTPVLLRNSAPVVTTGQPFAQLTAALPEFIDPSCLSTSMPTCAVLPSPQNAPSVFMAHEVPDVHVDQTWNVVYEGQLPNFTGIAAVLDAETSGFMQLNFSSTSAFFCGHGVEDQRLGLQRFAAMQTEDGQLSKPSDTTTYIPPSFSQRVGDYVQLTDDILGAADAGPGIPLDEQYWTEDVACWAGLSYEGSDLATFDPSHTGDQTVGLKRQQLCIDKYGAYGAEENPQRDFPILQAFEDHLVLGRYLYLDPLNRPTNGRIIAPPDTTPQLDFQIAQCCFHQQANFAVRTGGEWVALGSTTSYLHHVVADSSGACVQSCDPNLVLLNARAPETSVGSIASTTIGLNMVTGTAPTRNSAFAMRNPAFSFFLPSPIVTGPTATTTFSISLRDDTWQFTTRGQYETEGVSLTASNTAVLPVSSMFVAPLGAIAVVDSSSQGLFIIDLNTLTISDGSPFY